MARPLKAQDAQFVDAPAARRPRPRAADAAATSAASPALALQADLARRLDEDGRWSARRTLAFVAVTCGGFWATVAAVAALALR